MSISSVAESSPRGGDNETRPPSSASTRSKISAQKLHVNSKITGVLMELKDDIVDTSALCHMGLEQQQLHPDTLRLSGAENIYIEKNGKFTKELKQSFNNLDNNKCYDKFDEDLKSTTLSPLQIAIRLQQLWTKSAHFCFGLLGGLALLELITVIQMLPSNDTTRERFFLIYPHLNRTSSSLFYILLNVCLISLFDSVDLGHFRFLKEGRTLKFKKIIVIIVFTSTAFILFLCNSPVDDSFSLHDSSQSNFSFTFDPSSIMEVKHKLINWEFLCIWKDVLLVFSWFLLILSENEDHFCNHLIALKKYDFQNSLLKL